MSRLAIPAFAALLTLAAWAGGAAPGAANEPPAKEACDALEAERAGLAAAGVPELLKRPPAEVRAAHGAGKVEQVRRYIALQEQLLFRCGQAKLRVLPGAEAEEGAQAAAAKGGAPQAASSAPPVPPIPRRKPAAKPRPAAQKAPAAAAAGQGSEAAKPAAAKPKPRPKPAPKAKVDDAFRPPPRQEAPKD